MRYVYLILLFSSTMQYALAQVEQTFEQNVQTEVRSKIEALQKHIQVIADKSIAYDKRTREIDRALKLFYPDATIEVSNKRTGRVRQVPVEEYFCNLRDLSYNRVDISFRNYKVLPLIRNTDGSYQIDGLIVQVFRGYRTDGAAYSDTTIKRIKFDVATAPNNSGGAYYKIKIKEILVEETY